MRGAVTTLKRSLHDVNSQRQDRGVRTGTDGTACTSGCHSLHARHIATEAVSLAPHAPSFGTPIASHPLLYLMCVITISFHSAVKSGVMDMAQRSRCACGRFWPIHVVGELSCQPSATYRPTILEFCCFCVTLLKGRIDV